MAQPVRDSIFGRCLHLASGGKLLRYKEQREPSLWQSRLRNEKLMAVNRERGNSSLFSSRQSSRTVVVLDDGASDTTASTLAEAESGPAPNLVDWYGPQDPEVN